MTGGRLVVALRAVPGPAGAPAGQCLQLYGGYADTGDSDLSVRSLHYVPPVSGTEPVEGDSATFGLRHLVSPPQIPSWSFGIDLSRFGASSDTVTIDAWPLTLQIPYAFRAPSVTPYLGLGYSLTYVELDVSGASSLGVPAAETGFGDGPALLAGASLAVAEGVAIFLEYRRDGTRIDLETESIPILAPAVVTSRHEVDLETDRLLAGISYAF